MKTFTFNILRLAGAGGIALLATAASADEMTRNNLRGAGVPATGWYPAEVIEKRGMERYAQAWELEPCMNGATSPTGAYPSSEAEEVLDDSVAGTRGIGKTGDTHTSPQAGRLSNGRVNARH